MKRGRGGPTLPAEGAASKASPPVPGPVVPEPSPESPVGTLSRLVARFLDF